MSGLLDVPLGGPGSGRARYARAMELFQAGALDAAQLEAYRVAAADDLNGPAALFAERGLALPPDQGRAGAEAAVRALLDEADAYLATLSGPGLAEVRQGIARGRGGQFTPASGSVNPVVAAHLPAALAALAAERPALARAIAAAAPHLGWVTYPYPPDDIGPDFPAGHAFASILGEGAAIAAQGFDLGLFLIAPHVLYRDHHHAAPELYAPLTGPHGWRFGPGRPLVVKPAHRPVWNPPHRPHLTKVGPVPFLCLFGWTADVNEPAQVLRADDWPELEALRLG